jgi:hypothetical protein
MPRRKPRKPTGRPCKFGDRSVLVPLVAALARGSTLDDAARATGIGKSSLYRWISLSKAGHPRFAALAAILKERPRGGWDLWDLLLRRKRIEDGSAHPESQPAPF